MKYRDYFKYLLCESSWQGWDDITSVDKEEFKNILAKYMALTRRWYSEELSTAKLIRLKKLYSAMDSTDSTEALKIMARLSMEDRLSFGEFIPLGNRSADKVYEFLLEKSREYIEPIRISTPDITLSNIAKYNNGGQGDIEIFGLQDHRPEIGFGIGKHIFDDNFLQWAKNKPQFYIDSGRDWRIINFQEVLTKIKDAIEKYYKSRPNDS